MAWVVKNMRFGCMHMGCTGRQCILNGWYGGAFLDFGNSSMHFWMDGIVVPTRTETPSETDYTFWGLVNHLFSEVLLIYGSTRVYALRGRDGWFDSMHFGMIMCAIRTLLDRWFAVVPV